MYKNSKVSDMCTNSFCSLRCQPKCQTAKQDSNFKGCMQIYIYSFYDQKLQNSFVSAFDCIKSFAYLFLNWSLFSSMLMAIVFCHFFMQFFSDSKQDIFKNTYETYLQISWNNRLI